MLTLTVIVASLCLGQVLTRAWSRAAVLVARRAEPRLQGAR